MEKKKKVDYDAYLEEMRKDPEFRKYEDEKEKRWAARVEASDAIQRVILDDLKQFGVQETSLEEMVQAKAPLSADIVNAMLRWIPKVTDDRVKESLIRALAAAKAPFDGRPIIECFEQDYREESLRWPIANTMAEARPFGISDWLVQAIQVRKYGSARQMMALAVARLVPQETARPLLVSLLEELPGHVSMALAEIGGFAELAELESRVHNMDGWQKKEFEKAIRKIRKRLRIA